MQYPALLAGLLAVSASVPAGAAQIVRLPDCRFAGQSFPAADFSTNIPGNWTVTGPAQPTGLPAVGGPISATLSAWSAMQGYWIQPFGTGTTNQYGTAWGNAAGGDYTYELKFFLPCDPKNYSRLSLDGHISADNSFVAYLNSGQISNCSGSHCFQSATQFTGGGFVPGLNTFRVVVNNQPGSFTGLAVRASLVAVCGKECCRQLQDRGRGSVEDLRQGNESER